MNLLRYPPDFLFRVRKLREDGLSLIDIAAKFGVSSQYLQDAINQEQGEIDVLIGEMFKEGESENMALYF